MFKQAIENKKLSLFQIHSKIDFNHIKAIKMKKTKKLLKKLKISPLTTLIESKVNEKLLYNLQTVTDLHPPTNKLSQVNNHKTMNRNHQKNQML